MRRLLLCLTAFLFLCAPASAVDFDFSGTFSQDNDIVLLGFNVGSASTITIFSSSWGDGDIADDGYMYGGGLDPILAIWDSAGNLVNEQDDGHNVGTTLSNGVPYTHGLWDSYFDAFLTAGSYIASITQYDNFALGSTLSDGFSHEADPQFTLDDGFGIQPYFNGVWGPEPPPYDDPRTGDWEFHILNVASATVIPEPSTLLLLGTGLLCVIGGARRRKS